MPQRPVEPENAILVSGTPIYEEYEVKTAANMYPGKLVITDTTEYQIKVATDNSTAVLGVLDVMPDKNLKKMYEDTTTYEAGDQVRVIRGDCVVKLRADHAATITVGIKVYPAPDGNVDESATAYADIGIAETVPDTGASKDDDWVIVKLTNI
jgi:hypothetical protein